MESIVILNEFFYKLKMLIYSLKIINYSLILVMCELNSKKNFLEKFKLISILTQKSFLKFIQTHISIFIQIKEIK